MARLGSPTHKQQRSLLCVPLHSFAPARSRSQKTRSPPVSLWPVKVLSSVPFAHPGRFRPSVGRRLAVILFYFLFISGSLSFTGGGRRSEIGCRSGTAEERNTAANQASKPLTSQASQCTVSERTPPRTNVFSLRAGFFSMATGVFGSPRAWISFHKVEGVKKGA